MIEERCLTILWPRECLHIVFQYHFSHAPCFLQPVSIRLTCTHADRGRERKKERALSFSNAGFLLRDAARSINIMAQAPPAPMGSFYAMQEVEISPTTNSEATSANFQSGNILFSEDGSIQNSRSSTMPSIGSS